MEKKTEGFMIRKIAIVAGVVCLFIVISFIMNAISKADRTVNADPIETDIVATTSETTTTTVSTTTTACTTTTHATTTTATETTLMTTTVVNSVDDNDDVSEEEEYVAESYSIDDYNVGDSHETVTTEVAQIPTEPVVITEEIEEVNEIEEEANEVFLGNFRITGYIAPPGAKTASGTIPNSSRTIAMNATQFRNMGLEYGDKIRVEGIGTFILEDCGCKSGRIDIFRDSEPECYELTPYADAYLIKD